MGIWQSEVGKERASLFFFFFFFNNNTGLVFETMGEWKSVLSNPYDSCFGRRLLLVVSYFCLYILLMF